MVLIEFRCFPSSAAFDTLSRLHNSLGTRSTGFSLHSLVLSFGSFVINVTVPCPIASNLCPPPRVTVCGCCVLVNIFRSLHIWHVAPESTIQLLLLIVLADRAWLATKVSDSHSLLKWPSSCLGATVLAFCFLPLLPDFYCSHFLFECDSYAAYDQISSSSGTSLMHVFGGDKLSLPWLLHCCHFHLNFSFFAPRIVVVCNDFHFGTSVFTSRAVTSVLNESGKLASKCTTRSSSNTGAPITEREYFCHRLDVLLERLSVFP